MFSKFQKLQNNLRSASVSMPITNLIFLIFRLRSYEKEDMSFK